MGLNHLQFHQLNYKVVPACGHSRATAIYHLGVLQDVDLVLQSPLLICLLVFSKETWMCILSREEKMCWVGERD